MMKTSYFKRMRYSVILVSLVSLLSLFSLALEAFATPLSCNDESIKQVALAHSLQFKRHPEVKEYELEVSPLDVQVNNACVFSVENSLQTNQIGCSFRVVVDSNTGKILDEIKTPRGWWVTTDESWSCTDYGSDFGGGV
ncbi:MAG: hypothetical protein HYW85_00500 [Deltaproteobacteria bacterium]|nr:hypothetical protein [Deltaproteobacteria bacterium]MBI3017221.1 hypothetical protein [Deltaproteobacteria bacterium]